MKRSRLVLLILLAWLCPLAAWSQSGAAATPTPTPIPTTAPYTVSTLVPDGPLLQPAAVALDAAGNLYIADAGNNVIRKFDTGGNLTVLAGVLDRAEKYPQFNKAAAIASGQPIPDCTSTTGDHCLAGEALFSGPRGIAVDAKGNVFISDSSASKIRKVHAASGKVTVYAGKELGGWSSTQIHNPEGIALDSQGNLYIADRANNAVREVAPPAKPKLRGTMTTVAGMGPANRGCAAEGVPASAAPLNSPQDVAVDAAGDIYIADTGCHKIRRIGLDGTLTTVVGSGAGAAVPAIYNGPTAPALQVNLITPVGVKVDASGNLYISDPGADVVWLYNASTQAVSAIGGLGPNYIGNTVCTNKTNDFGDGCPGTQAKLHHPYRLAVDPQGNVYVPEQGGTSVPSHPFAIRVLQPAN